MEIAEDPNSSDSLAIDDSMVSDSALVAQAAGGCTTAFNELVRLHQSNLRYFLARFTNDMTVVDDLAQEVFLTAFRKIQEFKSESTFSTWLHGIAKNKGLHYLRTESRRKTREKKSFESAILDWKADALADESNSDQESFLEFLDLCLESLAVKGKSLIDQYYYQNKSSDEIAKDWEMGGGAIRMMLVRVRRALQKCVRQKKRQQENRN